MGSDNSGGPIIDGSAHGLKIEAKDRCPERKYWSDSEAKVCIMIYEGVDNLEPTHIQDLVRVYIPSPTRRREAISGNLLAQVTSCRVPPPPAVR
jgi:hypothetical protein